MDSVVYKTTTLARRGSFIAARRLPLCFAILLLALMALSYVSFGSVSPPGPQISGNKGYQKLWAGDVPGAVTDFDRALRSDAAFPYRWSDLGEGLEDAGKTDEARYCFRRALKLAPESPEIELRAANFAFRTGSAGDALLLYSRVLGQTDGFDQMIFRSWVRMDGGLAAVLDKGLGANSRASRAFFDFLIANASPGDAAEAWKWLESRGYIEPQQGREWAALLLRSNEPAQAAAVWADHVALDRAGYDKTNRVDNPGFEEDWPGGGFGWNSTGIAGVTVSADSAVARSGKRSLRLDVNSGENLDFHHFYQQTWMPPGKYRLEGWVRTQGFTTDQGIGLRVRDPAHEAELNAVTPSVTGTSEWRRVSRDFVISGKPKMVEVEIVRARSWEFDNRPRGTAWIDDIRIQPLP